MNIIFSESLTHTDGRKPLTLRIYVGNEGDEEPAPYPDTYDIILSGPRINLVTLIYECAKAAEWAKNNGGINEDRVDEPYMDLYTIGVWVEDVLAELQRQGWYWGCKAAPGSIFNRDCLLSIHAPGTPDTVEG